MSLVQLMSNPTLWFWTGLSVLLLFGLVLLLRHRNGNDSGSPAAPASDSDTYAPQNLPPPSDEVLALIRSGNTIAAARMYKEETDLGLLESKRVVTWYAAHPDGG